MELNNSYVIKVDKNSITFNNKLKLYSDHHYDCCEEHFLSFDNLNLQDFENLLFDLSNESFFERIVDYGIELKPINGYPVRIPGYGTNNGYYSSNLSLVLTDDKEFTKVFDISECQDINWS